MKKKYEALLEELRKKQKQELYFVTNLCNTSLVLDEVYTKRLLELAKQVIRTNDQIYTLEKLQE